MPEKSLSVIPRPLRDQYEKGLAAIQRQNLDYAIAIFTGVLQAEPAFYACREALRAAQMKKTGAGGGGFFKKMLGTASNSPMIAKGQMALRNNPLEAIHIAEQILGGDPNSIPAHRLLAEGALAADLPRTASLSLEIVFKNAPDREVAIKLGEALARGGQGDRAESILSELRRTFPNDPEIARVLKNVSAKRTLSEGGYEALEGGGGSYRDILKNKDEAVALEQEKREVKSDDVTARLIGEHEAQIVREPKNLRLIRSVAELYAQKKQFDKALEYYQRSMGTDGVSDPTLEKAIFETTLRKFDHALAGLDPQAADFAGQTERIQGERQTFEVEDCRRRVEKYPNDLQIRFELGELYFKAGKITEAIQEFQKAQANSNKRIHAMGYLGQCFARRGMNDLAARTFQNAIKEKAVFDEEKKDLIYQLGCTFEKMGKTEEAIEQFKIIYESDIGYKDVAAKVDAYYSSKG
jgi:tetratricopeptide (TPR) repeat protein